MQDLYFTPITTITIVTSLIIIVAVLFLYYICTRNISSIYKFQLNARLSSIKKLLENTSDYSYWWPKFKKFYIYNVNIENTYDNNLQNARITLKIHSNYSKETWEIILEQKQNDITNVIVAQELNLLPKLARICKSSFTYKKDLTSFKKALILALNNKNY